jgi:hypothetical protein
VSGARRQRSGSAVATARKRDVVHGIGVGVDEVETVPRLRGPEDDRGADFVD